MNPLLFSPVAESRSRMWVSKLCSSENPHTEMLGGKKANSCQSILWWQNYSHIQSSNQKKLGFSRVAPTSGQVLALLRGHVVGGQESPEGAQLWDLRRTLLWKQGFLWALRRHFVELLLKGILSLSHSPTRKGGNNEKDAILGCIIAAGSSCFPSIVHSLKRGFEWHYPKSSPIQTHSHSYGALELNDYPTFFQTLVEFSKH